MKHHDCIRVDGLRVFAYHGVHEEEQKNGQPFVLSLRLYLSLDAAAASDELTDTVHYGHAVRAAQQALCEHKFKLIERAAAHVADRLLAGFALLTAVTVILEKPRAPIAADFDTVAVQLTRHRGECAE